MRKLALFWPCVLGAAGYVSGFLIPEPRTVGALEVKAAPTAEGGTNAGDVVDEESEILPRPSGLRALVDTLTALDAEGLRDRYLRLFEADPRDRREILLVLTRWAEIDAVGGETFFQARSDAEGGSIRTEGGGEKVPSDELSRFRDILHQMYGEDEESELGVAKRLALSDPRAAVAMAREMAFEADDWIDLLNHLQRVDPAAVWAALPDYLPKWDEGDPFSTSFDFGAMARQDLGRLLTAVEEHAPGSDNLWYEIGAALPLDLDALRVELGKIEDPNVLKPLVEGILRADSREWIEAGAGTLSGASAFDRALVAQLMRDTGTNAVPEISRLAEILPISLLESLYLGENAEEIPESPAGIAILLRLNPPVLPTWVTELFDPPGEATAFPNAFPAPAMPPERSANYLWQIPPSLLAEVTEFLGKREDVPPERIAGLVSGWADRDPIAAAEWVEALPSAEAQNAAARSVVDAWAPYDLEGSAKWVATLPSGTMRDAATGTLVSCLVAYDQESARVWANSIGDAALRASALRIVDQEERR